MTEEKYLSKTQQETTLDGDIYILLELDQQETTASP